MTGIATQTATPTTVNVYRIFKGIPTRNSDKLRSCHTVDEAMSFRAMYEDAAGFAIAIYEADPECAGTEIVRYETDMGE